MISLKGLQIKPKFLSCTRNAPGHVEMQTTWVEADPEQHLSIRIRRAVRLAAMDIGGSSDPFVKVAYVVMACVVVAYIVLAHIAICSGEGGRTRGKEHVCEGEDAEPGLG